MNTLYLILYIIYGASIPTSLAGFVISARTSKVASSLGQGDYILGGLMISFIPVLNTLLAAGTILELLSKKKQ